MNEQLIRKHLRKLGVAEPVRHGEWLRTQCPLAPWYHPKGTDSSPSFGVKVTASTSSHFFCFTCKQSGSLPDLAAVLQQKDGIEGVDYDRIKTEAMFDDATNISDYEEGFDEAEELEPLSEAGYSDLYPSASQDAHALAYLNKRGVSLVTIKAMDLRYDAEQARVVFPVRDEKGALFGFTGRSILPPEEYPYKGYAKVRDYLGLPKRHLLLGEHWAEAGKPFLVVEGLFAWANLMEIGADDICNPVALLGSVLTDEKAERLMSWNEPVYLLPDDDEAGDVCLYGPQDSEGNHNQKGALSKLRNHVPLYTPLYPPGVDDPDDLTYAHVQNMLTHSTLIC